MSDKLVAGLVTAAVVGPLCSLCILGPTFIFSWATGWLAGLGQVVAGGLAIMAAILVYGLNKRRRLGRQDASADQPDGVA